MRQESTPTAALGPPWREAFELAWEAFKHGTTPVGAVITDGRGAIVARGRNRMHDGPQREEIGGNRLAHSEVNALLKLGMDQRYEDHELYVVLEPCLLCLGAAWMSTIGRLHYAGEDPYGGCASLRPANARSKITPMDVVGPRDDAFGRLAEALHVAFFLRRAMGRPVVAAYQETRPRIVEQAANFLGQGLGDLAEHNAPFQDVQALWEAIE